MSNGPGSTHDQPSPADAVTSAEDARLVLAVTDGDARQRLALRLRGGFPRRAQGERLASIDTSDDGVVVIVSDSLEEAESAAGEATRRGASTSVVLLAQAVTTDLALRAMRAGIADVITGDEPVHDLVSRVEVAADRARAVFVRKQREERLRRLAERMNEARQDVSRQVSDLCNDLVAAYQEVTDTMTNLTIAAEFSSLIRAELDVEALLRTALEFILAKVGPTNAAVFLPSTSDEYSLGAYVNYDCPKDTAEMLLDHLASVIPHRMETETEIVRLEGESDLVRRFGEGASWLGDAHVVGFSCHDEGECLAVVVLFRDSGQPFDDRATGICTALAGLMGEQLGKVIRIHHRHLPRDQWGVSDEADDGHDDLGLAA